MEFTNPSFLGLSFSISIRMNVRMHSYEHTHVLRTNTKLSTEEVALVYKNLWLVENTFRNIKDILKIRPIFLWSEARVRGHVFICFLAFLLTVALHHPAFGGISMGSKESLWTIIKDIRKVKAVKLRVKNEPYLVRTELKGMAYLAFKAVGLSFPLRVKPL